MPWVAIKASADPRNQQVKISVTDNGPGVPEDKVANLFTPFFTTRDGGTGLGLYIARELCSNNQAVLSYADQNNHGATFQISFKQQQQQLAL